jgi:Chaperone of endosialidase
MSKPKAPPPPDPRQTAAAATSTNVGTAVANAIFGNTNQITPQGELRYDQTGQFDWHDPYTGSTYNLPRFTATQILSEPQKAIQAQNEGAAMNMAGMANYQSGRLAQHLAGDINLSDMPAAGDPSKLANMPGLQTTFGEAGDITKTYGPADNFSADRQRVEESLMARLNPQLERERKAIETRLADQGIRYGGQAYGGAFDPYNRQANDARLAAIGAGGEEQQRMMNMAGQRAGFENAAQSQAFQQAMARGQFANTALGQNFAQQQAVLQAQDQARKDALTEAYAARAQPIQEVSALMSGSQVQQPNFMNTPRTNIPTTDVGGLINQRFQQGMDIYKQESAQHQALMGGLFGLAGGMMKMSDRRVKEAVVPLGKVFGVPVHEYSYKHDPQHRRHVGPMAQDVEKIDRKSVKTIGGIKHIDTGRLGAVLGIG